MFCHAITTAYLAFAFLTTGNCLQQRHSKRRNIHRAPDIHITVNIIIRDMFMSCKQVVIKTETVDIDKLGSILAFAYFKSCLFS